MSEIKEIEEAARISYMERQMEEVSGGEQATIAGVISDLREKGYTIKEIASGTNNVIGVKLNKSEISIGRNATEEIAYEYEYASGTTVRYFAEVQGKNYEIIFNKGEITVSTIGTDLTDIDKLPEVTVESSNGELVEAQKSEEGKITLISKNKGGEVTIAVTCAGKQTLLKVEVDFFLGIDKNETNPKKSLPEEVKEIIEDDSTKGIVIKDKNDREWVWIEVPKTIFTIADALGEERTEEELNVAIKSDLIAYSGIYGKGSASQNYNWSNRDTWYRGCGVVDNETYINMYNKMINSVYENGGFWIQRYEDGRVNINVATAQSYASQMSPDETKTSSLLFGIQWDLVCKYLEVKGGLTIGEINSNSSSWGNYSGSPNARQERNKKMNIYDFAGNYFEWTLDKAFYSTNAPCACRGGQYGRNDQPASMFGGYSSTDYNSGISFTWNGRATFRSTFY